MRIGFDADAINERGMSVALFDYATGVQEHLGHEAVVFYSPARSNAAVVEKFSSGLRMVPFEDRGVLQKLSEPYDLDFFYTIGNGKRHPLLIAAKRIGVHAVFRHFEPHGSVYAYVSDWLADWMTGSLAPAVPHIVTLPTPEGDMREELAIPKDAFVAGRYGGFDQFNVPMAQMAVARALEARSDLYCVFVNTERFIDHPRALFLPSVITLAEKARFIATCDVGLNAKKTGESFGLAIAEFLLLGKPVFSWAGGIDQNHVHMSPKKEWCYKTGSDLFRLLTTYHPDSADQELARSSVLKYAPNEVMRRFDDVFLSERYSADSLHLSRGFKVKRKLQQKFLRAKFRIWKTV